MKKFAYAASLVLLTGAVAGVSQTAIAQSAPAADAPAAAPAPAPAAPAALTANVPLASQYRYRGIMQTNNKPAIQGGFDYAIPGGVLPEGFYIGNWNSSISWLSDSNSNVSAPIEMDFYGGYKTEIVKDVPVSYLLYLEKLLDDMETELRKLPVLTADRRWTWDESESLWRTEPVSTYITSKIDKVIVKSERSEERRVGKECRSRWSP